MTTVSFIQKKCCICGKESRQAEIGVRNAMEPYDLDMRPTGAPRSSIYMWVQCCGACGYCASDISKAAIDAKPIINSEEYQQALHNRQFPESLNHFICLSMIQEAGGDYGRAGWAHVYCAWVCDDDSNIRQHAVNCRQEALRLFEKAQAEGQRFAENSEEEEIIKIDLLRRARKFDDAKKLCEAMLEKDCDKKTRSILDYQLELIEKGDAKVHTLNEALEDTD